MIIIALSAMAPWRSDRISNLSDELICHILSFIPTKNAVATSILSKRWNHLWRSVPLLDFSDIKLVDSESILLFNQFVYSVMLLREAAGNHSINTFNLDIAYANLSHVESLSLPNITKWVNIAVQRKVKHLNLHLNLPKYLIPDLPNCTIFTCKTLVVLNLSCLSLHAFSFSSDGFEFPLLKKLHLKYINFHYDRDFLLLLDGCPVLEDFKAFNIRPFAFKDATEQRQVFHSLSLNKLIRADITMILCNNIPMKALFNTEFLRIQLMQIFHPYDFPTFNNLTHLVINIDLDMLFMKVLHHCPKLQNLDLYERTQINLNWHIEEEEKIWVEPKSAPQFLSLYLRTCTFRDFAFEGLQHDIALARYILNNARVLQTMTIWSDKEQPEIERELSSCPTASATCQLSVY